MGCIMLDAGDGGGRDPLFQNETRGSIVLKVRASVVSLPGPVSKGLHFISSVMQTVLFFAN